MKSYVHARLGDEESDLLEELKRVTGQTESVLVKKGLRLVYKKEIEEAQSALDVASKSVGKFLSPISDLSNHKKHLKGFGE